MAFLRFTRDRRGYENTFLLHVAHPGERPRVLYWYRTAPGVRVGRPALDEDAIRTIEEQHPEIEFDWPHILEVGAITQPEIEEHPPVRPKRRPVREVPHAVPVEPSRADAPEPGEDVTDEEPIEEAAAAEAPPVRAHDLLEELVGREIATRLHARYSEIIGRIHRLPADHAERTAWEARADALNPDNWVTPDEVLSGVERADELFDRLRRELVAH